MQSDFEFVQHVIDEADIVFRHANLTPIEG